MTRLMLFACLLATSGCLGSSWRPPWEPRKGPPQFLYAAHVPESSSGGASDPSSYAAAAGAVASTVVASAANRAVFKTCHASCLRGTACNTATGLCAPLPCGGTCPADFSCRVVEGAETCVRGQRDAAAARPPEDALPAAGGDAAPSTAAAP